MQKLFPVLASLSLFGGVALAAPAEVLSSKASLPVPPKFISPPAFALSAVRPNAMGAWNFYMAAAGDTNAANYAPLAPGTDVNGNVVVSPGVPQFTLPFMVWPANDAAGIVTIRPESDGNVPGKKGDLIAMWTAPAKDLYLVKIDIDNAGLDVKGGDGGLLVLTRLRAGETGDTRVVDRVVVPPSSAVWPHAQGYYVVDAEAGERISLRFNAGADGYADQWKLKYSITRTGPEGYLAQPPAVAEKSGAPLRPGLFFLGTDSFWANSPFAAESIDLMRRYVPDLGLVMVSHQPERTRPLPFYRDNNIPILIQTWGATYEPYLQAKNAFEITWKGEDLSKPGLPLAGLTHAAAWPHPAKREAFERVVRSSRRSGYTGFGIQDMVWMWGGGRGASGYNPATIAAFRKDLQGLDEGLKVTSDSRNFSTVKFADYAAHYFGGMPAAAAFGLKSWSQYQPITFEQYSKKLKNDYTPDFLLFDMLVHYEWLKMADFLGQTARSENGVFQLMGNPEDVANGNDFYFASRLSSISMVSEEYFETALFLDGAYYHFPDYTRARKNGSSIGVILESGGGGNGIPYYDTEGAYANALELTLATRADHMECDFWTSNWGPFKDMLNNPLLVERYRQTLASALGFVDARRDGLRRMAPDFISITPRRIFRPYDTGWYPWAWRLKFPQSPEPVLAENGFSFEGMAEDGLGTLKTPQKVVLYSTAQPTQLGWERLSNLVRTGRIRRAIVTAGGLQQVVTKTFETRPFAGLYPQLSFPKTAPLQAGTLAVNGKVADGQTYKVAGDVYKATGQGNKVIVSLGAQPLVVRRSWGKGSLDVMLFDPAEPSNAPLSLAVYTALLRQDGIEPRWQSENGAVARLYQNGDLMAVGLQHPRDRVVRGDLSLPQGDQLTPRTWPYKIDGEMSVKVRLKAKQNYDWVALPSGVSGRSVADRHGDVLLRHKGTSHEVFYLLPHNDANNSRFQQIRDRKLRLDEAMTLGGRIATTASQLTP